MANLEWEFQKGLFALLSGAGHDVFDNVTQADGFPYLVIGDDDVADESNSCGDAYEILALVRCFADGPARKATKTVAASVRDLLKQTRPTVSGHVVVLSNYEGTVFQAMQDGLRHQGIVRMRYRIRPAS